MSMCRKSCCAEFVQSINHLLVSAGQPSSLDPSISAIKGRSITRAQAKNTGPAFFHFPVFSIVCAKPKVRNPVDWLYVVLVKDLLKPEKQILRGLTGINISSIIWEGQFHLCSWARFLGSFLKAIKSFQNFPHPSPVGVPVKSFAPF